MLPDRIPIAHEPGHDTDTIGRFRGGQFFGCVVAAFRGPWPEEGWQAHKRWYAVLHRFDAEGNHVNTDAWFAGTTADGERAVIARAEERLGGWLADLPDLAYGDIAVKLFAVVIDDVRFGLIDETDEDHDHVELYPNELGFDEPWDGLYDT